MIIFVSVLLIKENTTFGMANHDRNEFLLLESVRPENFGFFFEKGKQIILSTIY